MAAVAVVALGLAGYLLIGSAREAQARTGCLSNLRQIGLTLLNYEASRGHFPAGTVPNASLAPDQRLSWWSFLSNYIGQNLFFLFDRDESWNGGANGAPRLEVGSDDPDEPRTTEPIGTWELVQCPAHRRPAPKGIACDTHYVGIAGVGLDAPTLPAGHPRAGIFGYDRETPMAGIKDGAASTLLIAETSSGNGPWTRGGRATVRGLDPARAPYLGPRAQFGGLHPQATCALFADGSVRVLGDSMNPRILEALSTAAGGEPLPAGWDH
jgi:hypothetical protein